MKQIISHTSYMYAAAGVVTLALIYVALEPMVVRSQATDSEEFVIRQEITDELSLTLSTTTVEMDGAIAGITGGNATGTLKATVEANTGYTITLAFDNSPAMLGDTTGNTNILDYPSGPTPTIDFTPGASAYFAYTVAASTTSDLADAFLDNGTNCGVAGTYNAARCWKGPTTAPFTIVDRDDSAIAGADTTITFRVNVPNNPSPGLDADWYTATATLTATAQ